jgi:hypothetical protein
MPTASRSRFRSPVSRAMRVPRRVPHILTAFIAIASPAEAECLSSAESVLAAHQGSHAVWTRRLPGHIGEKCWFASSAETKVIHTDESRDDARQIKPTNAEEAPLPRPRSQDALTTTEQAPPPALAKPDSTGEARSILIWGRPMDLDAVWEEIFARRERAAE